MQQTRVQEKERKKDDGLTYKRSSTKHVRLYTLMSVTFNQMTLFECGHQCDVTAIDRCRLVRSSNLNLAKGDIHFQSEQKP